MSEVDDLKFIKQFTMRHVEEVKRDIEASVIVQFDRQREKMDEIWRNNLLVPELIGPGCKYHDLKEYLTALQP